MKKASTIAIIAVTAIATLVAAPGISNSQAAESDPGDDLAKLLGSSCMVSRAIGIQPTWLSGGTVRELLMALLEDSAQKCTSYQGYGCGKTNWGIFDSYYVVDRARSAAVAALKSKYIQIIDRLHADAQYRRSSVRAAARYAVACDFAEDAALLVDVFEESLQDYRQLKQFTEINDCRYSIGCNPRRDPAWGGEDMYVRDPGPCFRGCDGLQGAFDRLEEQRVDAGNTRPLRHDLLKMILRREKQGVGILELEHLVGIAKQELAPGLDQD